MRLLEHQAGIRPAVVKTIQRQDGAYRDAVSLLADGYTAEGFEALNKMGWIREIEDEGDRYRAIAHEFADIIDRKEEVLATAPTHAEGELLTAAIRHELTRRGIIAKESATLQQLKPLRLTHAEKAEGGAYQPRRRPRFHTEREGLQTRPANGNQRRVAGKPQRTGQPL